MTYILSTSVGIITIFFVGYLKKQRVSFVLSYVQSVVVFRIFPIMQLSKTGIMTGNEEFIITHFNYRKNYNLKVLNSR